MFKASKLFRSDFHCLLSESTKETEFRRATLTTRGTLRSRRTGSLTQFVDVARCELNLLQKYLLPRKTLA
jgi:hypothetical protein